MTEFFLRDRIDPRELNSTERNAISEIIGALAGQRESLTRARNALYYLGGERVYGAAIDLIDMMMDNAEGSVTALTDALAAIRDVPVQEAQAAEDAAFGEREP